MDVINTDKECLQVRSSDFSSFEDYKDMSLSFPSCQAAFEAEKRLVEKAGSKSDFQKQVIGGLDNIRCDRPLYVSLDDIEHSKSLMNCSVRWRCVQMFV